MSIQNLLAKENPSSAAAVRNTLITVTQRVPGRRESLSEKRLETIVQPEMTMVTMPI